MKGKEEEWFQDKKVLERRIVTIEETMEKAENEKRRDNIVFKGLKEIKKKPRSKNNIFQNK